MKNLILVLSFMLTATAFAQNSAEISVSKTPDIFAPKMGSSELLFGLLLPTGTIEYQGRSSKYSGFLFGAQYAYGFNDHAAFFVAQGYQNFKTTSDFSGASVDSTTKGFGNTSIGIKGIIDAAQGFFYYNANYTRALFEKDKTNTSNNESTATSARPALHLNVGAGADIETFGFGALLGYDIYQEGDRENESNFGSSTTTLKAANGSSWKIYAQFQPSWKLGASYGISTTDAYDQVSNGTTTKMDKTETKYLSVYGIIPVNAQSEVMLEAMKPEPVDGNGIDYKIYYLNASYRFSF